MTKESELELLKRKAILGLDEYAMLYVPRAYLDKGNFGSNAKLTDQNNEESQTHLDRGRQTESVKEDYNLVTLSSEDEEQRQRTLWTMDKTKDISENWKGFDSVAEKFGFYKDKNINFINDHGKSANLSVRDSNQAEQYLKKGPLNPGSSEHRSVLGEYLSGIRNGEISNDKLDTRMIKENVSHFVNIKAGNRPGGSLRQPLIVEIQSAIMKAGPYSDGAVLYESDFNMLGEEGAKERGNQQIRQVMSQDLSQLNKIEKQKNSEITAFRKKKFRTSEDEDSAYHELKSNIAILNDEKSKTELNRKNDIRFMINQRVDENVLPLAVGISTAAGTGSWQGGLAVGKVIKSFQDREKIENEYFMWASEKDPKHQNSSREEKNEAASWAPIIYEIRDQGVLPKIVRAGMKSGLEKIKKDWGLDKLLPEKLVTLMEEVIPNASDDELNEISEKLGRISYRKKRKAYNRYEEYKNGTLEDGRMD